MGASAYTIGNHIVLAPASFALEPTSRIRLMAHELAHVVQQSGAPAPSGALPGLRTSSPRVQRQQDRNALLARLAQVRAQLAQLRRQSTRLSDDFSSSLMEDREQESLRRGTEQLHAQARSEAASRLLWGGEFAAARIRRAATVASSGTTATVSVNLQITYPSLSDAAGRRRAASDIPRIAAAIRDVWQVDIATGDYAGVSFRMSPTIAYLAPGAPQASNAFLISVRGRDADPSSGDSVSGVISLALAHLDGPRVIVVAHELAHLFGFTDAYLKMTTRGAHGQSVEQWSVARADPANRPDLLGLIDPGLLSRLQRKGAVSAQDVARQTGTVRVWEEEASIVLRTLGASPPPRASPTPDSEDFDPTEELNRIRREGEARLGQIRGRRARVDNSLAWLEVTEQIIQLESEERSLVRQLGAAPP
jgi:hypothetical protein